MSIIDDGAGIAEENIGKLFVDFGRLDENSKLNKAGTGLGLSICKKIIEHIGGTVTVQSQIGEGSEFIISMSSQCLIS